MGKLHRLYKPSVSFSRWGHDTNSTNMTLQLCHLWNSCYGTSILGSTWRCQHHKATAQHLCTTCTYKTSKMGQDPSAIWPEVGVGHRFVGWGLDCRWGDTGGNGAHKRDRDFCNFCSSLLLCGRMRGRAKVQAEGWGEGSPYEISAPTGRSSYSSFERGRGWGWGQGGWDSSRHPQNLWDDHSPSL